MKGRSKKFFKKLGLLGIFLLLLLLWIMNFKPQFFKVNSGLEEIDEAGLDIEKVMLSPKDKEGKGRQLKENLPYIRNDKKPFTKKMDPSEHQIKDKRIFELIR